MTGPFILPEDHNRRVTELIEANNREVERRRAAEAECARHVLQARKLHEIVARLMHGNCCIGSRALQDDGELHQAIHDALEGKCAQAWIDEQIAVERVQREEQPIIEEWLKANGFKWHQFDRQPEKHWLLWIGDAVGTFTSYEDLGIEVAPNVPGHPEEWFVWLRGDCAGRYHRFIHTRHMRTTRELVALIEALTGRPFDPADCLYGSLRTPEQAARIRREHERLDQRLNRTGHPWGEAEKDDARGRALPEHLNHHIKTTEKKGDGR